MLAEVRRQRIMEELQHGGSVTLGRLSALLGVSDMTIRRDLAALEHEGHLERVRGGAMALQRGVEEPGFDKKLLRERPEKAAIAEAAAAMVRPGTAIGLTAGTTTWMLARRLARVDGITVFTNSMKVWNELQHPGGRTSAVILTGGEFRTPSDALVGPTAELAIRSMYVDVLFMGVHGMDPVAGFTTPNLYEAETNRTFIEHARRVVVLADHTKWRTVGLSIMAPLSRVDALVTDSGISEEGRQMLTSQIHDVRFVRAPAVRSARAADGPRRSAATGNDEDAPERIERLS
ncbi:MAG: DeoR family transcriptional regulator [Acidimicrobiaceae bacterium]|nr:DeoR family transcriptional regulator [Acidimicrobiaceae bacterium]